jgi:TonB family protein
VLRYLINYFIARTTYDAVYRHGAHKAQQRAAVNYQQALAQAELQMRRNYVPPIDDNMVNAGRQHALLGSSEEEVNVCYGPPLGEHERKNAYGAGIRGAVYRVGCFDVGVEFERDRSVRECWAKNMSASTEVISAGEVKAIMDNKAYGPGWTQLQNSSETRLWFRSETGLIACCDWQSPIAGGCALTIFDPAAGTPPGLPALPPLPQALPAHRPVKKTNGCVVALCVVVGLFLLPSIIKVATEGLQSGAKPTPSPTETNPYRQTAKVSDLYDSPSPETKPEGAPVATPAAEASPTAGASASAKSVAPKMLSSPNPAYPFAAKRDKLHGTGRFRLKFGRDGRVLAVEVVQSTRSSILDDAAVSTLGRWRCQPSSNGWVTIVPVTFTPPTK